MDAASLQRNNLQVYLTKIVLKLFCRSPLPHKFVNLAFSITYIKDELTNLRGNRLFEIDFENALCEMEVSGVPAGGGRGETISRCSPRNLKFNTYRTYLVRFWERARTNPGRAAGRDLVITVDWWGN